MQEAQETQETQSLGQEDPLRRKWQPTQVLLPGKSHGQRSLLGYSPWDCKEVRHDLQLKTTTFWILHYVLLLTSLSLSSYYTILITAAF